jgi:predicted GNAT family N-acyltransferase
LKNNFSNSRLDWLPLYKVSYLKDKDKICNIGGFNVKYTYITNYKNNEILRFSFNELTKKTFNFNFVKWFNDGFWGDKYIPYSLLDGEKVISNVSVNLMDFNMDGTDKHYIQIGTVMTDKEYRGQGLNRYLIERVISEYKEKVDGIYLFGNDSVVNFYPKFGFIRGTEYQYSKEVNITNSKAKIQHIKMDDKISKQRVLDTARKSVSNERLSMNNFGLTGFWITGPMSDLVYYYDNEDAYIIAEINNEMLCIHQIISTHKVNLERIISSFGSTIKKVILGFTPYNTDEYDITEFHKEDCTFFYLGKDLENIEMRKLIFPTISHA